MRILVADDDNTSRAILAAVLRRWGYALELASDGTEAWAKLQEAHAPEVAILDWMMPGLDGVEICRRARHPENDLCTYIILLTMRNSKKDLVEGLEAGADDYITKPFEQDDLRARLHVAKRVSALQRALSERVLELQDALAHVKTLQGLLPICAHCHKIRDDGQVWLNLEKYIEQHSEARLTHGLCPECIRELYPEHSDVLKDMGL